MNIVILTGDEIRHQYFRKKIELDSRINLLCSFCESDDESLEKRVLNDENSGVLTRLHVRARTQSEIDFFKDLYIKETSNIFKIKKGTINDNDVVNKIINYKPDLLVCFGSSLIKSSLIDIFRGKFINIHLGLTPYYRGSGANIWPLIN